MPNKFDSPKRSHVVYGYCATPTPTEEVVEVVEGVAVLPAVYISKPLLSREPFSVSRVKVTFEILGGVE